MITALVGALVGGLINVAAYVIAQKLRKKKIQWGVLAGTFVGGAVGGALAGATFGLGFLGAGGLKTVGYLAATGAASSGAQQVTTNVATGQPAMDGLAVNMAESAGSSVLLYGAARGLVKLIPELNPIIGPDAAKQASNLRRVANRVKYARSAHAAFAIAVSNATQGWFGSLAGGVAGGVAPDVARWGCRFDKHVPEPVRGIVDKLCAAVATPAPATTHH